MTNHPLPVAAAGMLRLHRLTGRTPELVALGDISRIQPLKDGGIIIHFRGGFRDQYDASLEDIWAELQRIDQEKP